MLFYNNESLSTKNVLTFTCFPFLSLCSESLFDHLLMVHSTNSAAPYPSPPPPSQPSPPPRRPQCTVYDGPTKAEHEYVLQNPQDALQNRTLTDKFKVAPWLLPPNSTVFPYSNITDGDIDSILRLRSKKILNTENCISLLFFDAPFTVMFQNLIYTMTKFGGAVDNFVVGVWSDANMNICRNIMNFPCIDVRNLTGNYQLNTVDGEESTGEFAKFHSDRYLRITWLKPIVVLALLEKNYAVHFVDSDVSFTTKPLWESLLTFIQEGNADGAFQLEGPLNTGMFIVLPKNSTIELFRAWAGLFYQGLILKNDDQQGLVSLEGTAYKTCRDYVTCLEMYGRISADEDRRDRIAIIRLFPNGDPRLYPHHCAFRETNEAFKANPCSFRTLFIHPVCQGDYLTKINVLKHHEFWFLDDTFFGKCFSRPENGLRDDETCPLLVFANPRAEDAFRECPQQLGFIYPAEGRGQNQFAMITI